MLIEFSVKNFRSIREKQTLSLVANNKDKQLPGNLIEINAPGLSNTKLLKSSAIYGANASGKSNLFKAAEFIQQFVLTSATKPNPEEKTGVTPFRLDSHSSDEPSEFEMIFIYKGVRYQYGFALDNKRVHEEWLITYPVGQPQRWFSRVWNSDKKQYDWKIGKKLLGETKSLKTQTKKNSLFLSTAAQFNHKQLCVVYDWFANYIFSLSHIDSNYQFDMTSPLLLNREKEFKEIFDLIKNADLGISGINVVRMKSEDVEDIVDAIIQMAKSVKLEFIHLLENTEEEIAFDKDDESLGTLKYYFLLGPFLLALKMGYTVFIDEIGAQMHPLLVRQLVQMINDPKINTKGAQLILTTHDTTLLDTSLFRRDQIWFTEKNKAGATTLYPLTDFKPRSDEALQKGYLAGRYGAIPFLGEFPF